MSDVVLTGPSYTEHEERTGSLILHEHEFTASLTLDEIDTAPFREQWMKDGSELFHDLELLP